MATPVQMNATMIATEGIRRAGIMRPAPEDISRASRIWLPEILSDICTRTVITGHTRLKSLERRVVIGLRENQRSYSVPTDMEEEAVLTLYKACVREAGPTSVTQANDPEDDLKNIYLEMLGGFGGLDEEPIDFGEYVGYRIFFATSKEPRGRYILDFDLLDATFSAGNGTDVAAKWLLKLDDDNGNRLPLVPPNEGDDSIVYVALAKNPNIMEEIGWKEMDHRIRGGCAGTPYYFSKMQGRLELDVPPDSDNYVIDLRYYANVNAIDWSEDPFPQIYSRWRHVLVPGIRTMMYFEKGDLDSYDRSKRDFDEQVENLIRKEVPYGGQFEGFTLGQYDGTGYGD